MVHSIPGGMSAACLPSGPVVAALRRYCFLFSLKHPQKLSQNPAIKGHGGLAQSFGLWWCEFCPELSQVSFHAVPCLGWVFDCIVVLQLSAPLSIDCKIPIVELIRCANSYLTVVCAVLCCRCWGHRPKSLPTWDSC